MVAILAIDILLKSIKLSADELKKAILSVDSKTLQPHIVVELLKLLPTADEIMMLQQFENDEHNMAVPEAFFWNVSKIHRYAERIKALYVRGMFDEWMDDAKKQVKYWSAGCKDVQTSKRFMELLQVRSTVGGIVNCSADVDHLGFRKLSEYR